LLLYATIVGEALYYQDIISCLEGWFWFDWRYLFFTVQSHVEWKISTAPRSDEVVFTQTGV